MKTSSTLRLLKGQQTDLLPAPVQKVYKWGQRRIVVDAEKNRVTVSERKLKGTVHKHLRSVYE